LFILALLAQTLLLLVLTFNSGRLVDDAVSSQIQNRVTDINQLLSAALSGPLAQRDLTTVKDIVNQISRSQDLYEITVRDRSGAVVAEFKRPLDGAEHFQASGKVELAGTEFGETSFSLSGQSLETARRKAYLQSAVLAFMALLASGAFLLMAGVWVSRHFRTLRAASARIAGGDYRAQIPLLGEPEIDQLASAFNHMSESVRGHVSRLQENEARFHAIADYTYDLEFWLSPEGRLLWINPSAERMLGYSVTECMADRQFPLNIIHAEDRGAAELQLRQALHGTSGNGYLFRASRKDGSVFWANANWLPIHDKHGTYIGLRASLHNVDELKNVEASLRNAISDLRQAERLQTHYLMESEQEKARLVSLLSAMSLGILFVGPDGRVIYHNPAFNRMWKIDQDSLLIGMPVNEVLLKTPDLLAHPEDFRGHLLSVLENLELTESYEIQMADGRVLTENDYPVRDKDSNFSGHLWIYEDVTNERQTADQLAFLAERDALTGLYNRHRFQSELTRMLVDSRRHQARCALIFFDLDEFKEINDNFGHRAGDALLIRVAGEVNALVRRNEVFARLGGDEFAILVPHAGENEAEALAERVIRAIAQIPFQYEGNNLRLTASIGIAYHPEHAADEEELVAKADIAMYQAKQAGKNTWRIYRADAEATRTTVERLAWSERISQALDRGLLCLHFQGIYHLEGRRLSHLEALVRMIDEDNPDQFIMPANFIPVAEKTGRILDIDRWVIGETIRTLAEYPDGPGIAVNVSARTLSEPALPRYIEELLVQHKVEPARFIVELTETAAVADLHDAQRLIDALGRMGCGVCLDDFGTGFSSFAYLKHLQADTLKIDGSFIKDLHADTDNQVFVKAMTAMAKGLGKTVIAEYVEDERVLFMLKAFGIDMVQGYLLDRPASRHPGLGSVHAQGRRK
jgi:diguanylate cyclase (GGDEF)-like protein/PAS domain S-box-containing protein